jgi:hypothetical protein
MYLIYCIKALYMYVSYLAPERILFTHLFHSITYQKYINQHLPGSVLDIFSSEENTQKVLPPLNLYFIFEALRQ